MDTNKEKASQSSQQNAGGQDAPGDQVKKEDPKNPTNPNDLNFDENIKASSEEKKGSEVKPDPKEDSDKEKSESKDSPKGDSVKESTSNQANVSIEMGFPAEHNPTNPNDLKFKVKYSKNFEGKKPFKEGDILIVSKETAKQFEKRGLGHLEK